ncbi:MAG TPA: elongation factor Ts [Clostridiaceae bacterium]|nr:elongation factor Ts [Clostridiaceae bacterium]
MANISAAMVKELREKTGAGMMDCKKALTATDGDFDKAINWLRENGLATAEKKAGRATTEGWVYGVTENDNKTGALVEINIETDFAAKNENFQLLVKNIAYQALATELGEDDTENKDKLMAAPYNYNKDITVETAIKEEVGAIGENITFRRAARYELDEPGLIDIYIHGEGRVGVMVELLTGTEDTAKNEATSALARDLAMQIAAMKPLYLNADSVPEEVLENEREVARAAARKEGKPEKIIENIVTGKLKRFYSDFCLLEQDYIHEEGITVEKAVANAARNLDDSIKVSRFLRYERGEGLEKKECCSFAEEVAQQLK